MPLETSIFPEEVQVAFFIFSLLSDRWEGMSGSYLGKDWTNIEYFITLYASQYCNYTIIYILKAYENLLVESRYKDAEKKRKAEERKKASASSGNTFAHNVRG